MPVTIALASSADSPISSNLLRSICCSLVNLASATFIFLGFSTFISDSVVIVSSGIVSVVSTVPERIVSGMISLFSVVIFSFSSITF